MHRRHRQHHRISIHALREEGDKSLQVDYLNGQISIHALREEGDALAYETLQREIDFYPRPPRGGRPANNS